MIGRTMLRSIPHPIRPNSLAVFSRNYPIGIVGDDSAAGYAWTWVLHPDGLPISVAGRSDDPEEGMTRLSAEWERQLSTLGLEMGDSADAGQASLKYEEVYEGHFWLKSGTANVGQVMIIRPGGGFAMSYRWEVADHPSQEHRFGFAADMAGALDSARVGWQEWLKWAGLKAKTL